MQTQEEIIILGLGSNLGDKLANLRQALQFLKLEKDIKIISVAPVYQSEAMTLENEKQTSQSFYYNTAVKCKTILSAPNLLDKTKSIEQKIGREKVYNKWADRIIDIDILSYGNKTYKNEILTIPHAGLYDRPFALFPLTDILPEWFYFLPADEKKNNLQKWGSRFAGDAPFKTKQVNARIDAPIMCGILNITPDSFSDGNEFLNIDAALTQINNLINSGADVIDIGAESTRPDANVITAELEWQRLKPILQAINKEINLRDIKISIDTKNACTAMRAIDLINVAIINDVTAAGGDKNMLPLVAKNNVKYIFMHSLSIPPSLDKILPQEQNIILQLLSWAENKINECLAHEIKKEQLIFDPGIGFGKTYEQSLLIAKEAYKFKNLSVPILIGHSRKRFLQLMTDVEVKERDLATGIITQYLKNNYIDYVRVHNVKLCLDIIKFNENIK